MRIGHNISALNTLNNITSSNEKINKGMEKLSSGLNISKAADNTSGLAISEKMRAQIRGLDQAGQNIQAGISLVQIAEGGLEVIQNPNLIRLRELSVQAASDTLSDSDREVIQREVNQIKKAIDQIANDTEFNTINLLNGTKPKSHINSSTNSIFNYENVLKQPPVTSTGSFTFGTDQGYPTTDADNNKTLVFGSGSTSMPSVRVDGTSYYLSSTVITNTVENGGVYTTVFTIPDKNVEVVQLVTTIEDKYEIKYMIKNSDTDNQSIGFQYHLDTMLGNDDSAPFVINGNTVDTQTVYLGDNIPTDFTVYNQNTGTGGNAEFQGFGQINGDGIIEKPSKFAIGTYSGVDDWDFNSNTGSVGDSGYSVWWDQRTINSGESFTVNTFYGQSVPSTLGALTNEVDEGPYDLLLQVGPNENNQFKVQLSDVRTSVLGINDLDVLTTNNATNAISKIDEAINLVTSERTKYGSYSNGLDHISSNVSNYKMNLTATESLLRDVDIAKEISELKINQVILQSSQAMYTQANQLTQSILQFLE